MKIKIFIVFTHTELVSAFNDIRPFCVCAGTVIREVSCRLLHHEEGCNKIQRRFRVKNEVKIIE